MKESSNRKTASPKLEENKPLDIEIKTSPKKTNKRIGNDIITYTIAIIILFLNSFFVLFSSIKKGFLKKEVLTKKSNIGFDIIIKS
tara:strand:+ start:118 stop:375 length:258 start_codon:yes stop_codon:yes gene_type:complete